MKAIKSKSAQKETVSINGKKNSVKNITLHDIATGTVDLHDREAYAVALQVLEHPTLENAYKTFRQLYEIPIDCLADVLDCVLDFGCTFNRVSVYVSGQLERTFYGFGDESSSEETYHFLLDGCNNINLDDVVVRCQLKKYKGDVFAWMGHYCFAKGRISFEKMMHELGKQETVA